MASQRVRETMEPMTAPAEAVWPARSSSTSLRKMVNSVMLLASFSSDSPSSSSRSRFGPPPDQAAGAHYSHGPATALRAACAAWSSPLPLLAGAHWDCDKYSLSHGSRPNKRCVHSCSM